jgi:hypothetical protein
VTGEERERERERGRERAGESLERASLPASTLVLLAKRKALLRERGREAESAQQQRDPERDRERAAAQQPRERTAESEAGKRQSEHNRETAAEKQRERTSNYQSPERQSERSDRESAGASNVAASVSPLRPASAQPSTPTFFQRAAGFQPLPISLGKASEKEVNTTKYWHRRAL